jgi:hypothetical protein
MGLASVVGKRGPNPKVEGGGFMGQWPYIPKMFRYADFNKYW